MKLSIKDIFTPENIEEKNEVPQGPTINESEKQENNRMMELIKSFDEKGEILKKESSIIVDNNKIREEAERLKTIARLDELGTGNQFTGNISSVMGLNQTVNSFIDTQKSKGDSVNAIMNNMLNSPNSNKLHNPNYTYLQEAEALRLSISRALNSGAPVNGIGFYEEVNHVMNQLGFNAKSPLDIKQAVLKLIKD